MPSPVARSAIRNGPPVGVGSARLCCRSAPWPRQHERRGPRTSSPERNSAWVSQAGAVATEQELRLGPQAAPAGKTARAGSRAGANYSFVARAIPYLERLFVRFFVFLKSKRPLIK